MFRISIGNLHFIFDELIFATASNDIAKSNNKNESRKLVNREVLTNVRWVQIIVVGEIKTPRFDLNVNVTFS